jgi:hypothetical protein
MRVTLVLQIERLSTSCFRMYRRRSCTDICKGEVLSWGLALGVQSDGWRLSSRMQSDGGGSPHVCRAMAEALLTYHLCLLR